MDQLACEIGVGGHLKPDPLLQEAVVAFAPDVGGGLPIGRKHRDDSTEQAESDQLSQTAGMEPVSRHVHVVVH